MSRDPASPRPGEEPIGDGGIPEDDGLPEVDDLEDLDPLEAERLLDGVPADGPVPSRLGDLLAAAAGPARPDELAGEASALAAFRAAHATAARSRRARPAPARIGASPSSPRRAPRTRHLAGPATHPRSAYRGARSAPHRPRTVRPPVMVLGMLLVLGGLGATAVAAGLTAGAGRPTNSVAQPSRPDAPRDSTASVASAGVDRTTIGTGSWGTGTTMTGGGLSPAARKKLCRTWSAPGNENPAKAERKAEATRALAEAAGGTERIEEYCRGSVPSMPPGRTTGDQAAADSEPGMPSAAPSEGPQGTDAPESPPGPSGQSRGPSQMSGAWPAPIWQSQQDGQAAGLGADSRPSGLVGALSSRL